MEESPDYMDFVKFLGRGSSGTVSLYKYKGQYTGKTHYTAVKMSEHTESLNKEFMIMSQFKGCSRIVQCYSTRVQKSINEEEEEEEEGKIDYYIAMEYAPGGSLMSFMRTFKDKKLPDSLIRDFTRMILQGLDEIHRRWFVHCDLKPENILVFPTRVKNNGVWETSYELKITDFGLSKRGGDNSWWNPNYVYVGTPIYMPPESVMYGETTSSLDLWSLGCVVLEMYTGKKPWWHTNNDVIDDLEKCYSPLIPNDLPNDAKDFIKTCFELKPEERRDAEKLMEHCFLRKVTEEPLVNLSEIDLEVELEKMRNKEA